MNISSFSRRWRTILWLLIGFVLVLLAFLVWETTRWRLSSDDAEGIRWRRGGTTHWDKNRDGLTDEIRIYTGKPDEFFIRQDLDADGWLDVEFESSKGIWGTPSNIRQRAPRHPVPLRRKSTR
jgi:hypothetical protein